jgi:hypothetical protein
MTIATVYVHCSPATMQPHECALCNRTLCLPLAFPCGHSGACAECVLSTTPQRRNCVICGVRCKTPLKKLPINRTLDATLRYLLPKSFAGRPGATDTTQEVVLSQLLALGRQKALEYAVELPPAYLTQCEATITRHVERSTTCTCGLFCVPKKTRLTGKRFYGCPRWSPALPGAPPRGCGFWRWLSAAEDKKEESGN